MADSGAVPPVFSGHLGRRVRFYRLQAELTQSELARRAGLNQGFLSEIERGRRRPSTSTARAIASALDLPVAVLVGEGPDHDAPRPLETRHLPLVDDIPLQPPDPAAGESFPVLRHLYAANRYCLRLTLDSMEPTLKPGDIVLVEYRRSARPEHVVGRICACLIGGRPLLARVFLEQRDGQAVVVLRPDHPDAAPQVIADPSELSIQGVVTHLVSRAL